MINAFASLKQEVNEIREAHNHLKPDEAFIVWFMRGFLTDDEDLIITSLVGGSGDKSVDAVYIDHENRVVCIIQGKYQSGSKPKSVPRTDIIALANTGRCLLEREKKSLKRLLEKCSPRTAEALEKSRDVIHGRDYRLNLYFVTTGSVSQTSKNDAEDLIDNWVHASLDVHTRKTLLSLMQDYIEGAAPPIPTVAIPYIKDQLFGRYDSDTTVNSYTFTARGSDIGRLFKRYGVRLFARNIRGYLGATSINDAMRSTIEHETQYFWHFNNGVTIICDKAKTSDLGHDQVIRVSNPQIINGQQTTRVLAENPKEGTEIVVRVIAVPREGGLYSQLVGSIVAAANSQNAISISDLRSNDLEQVRLERDMAKLRYAYIRKRMSGPEITRRYGRTYRIRIRKTELATAIASCTLDPAQLRKGKEKLFLTETYSKLFSGNRSALEYLAYYWAHYLISSRSSDPTRGYGRYLVTHFCWSLCTRPLMGDRRKQAFIESCETLPRRLKGFKLRQFPRELRPFIKLADLAFDNSVRFYKANRRNNGKIIDASGYFKNNTGLHIEFPNFITSNRPTDSQQASNLASQFGVFFGGDILIVDIEISNISMDLTLLEAGQCKEKPSRDCSARSCLADM